MADFEGQSSAIYALPLVGALVNTWLVARLMDSSGPRTLMNGLKWGALVWLCIVLPYGAVHNTFSAFPASLTLIDGGMSLITLLATGAVAGAWPVKRPVASNVVPLAKKLSVA